MKRDFHFFVYIATNRRHTVLYTGVTNNIFQRQSDHESKISKNSLRLVIILIKLFIMNFFPILIVPLPGKNKLRLVQDKRSWI